MLAYSCMLTSPAVSRIGPSDLYLNLHEFRAKIILASNFKNLN